MDPENPSTRTLAFLFPGLERSQKLQSLWMAGLPPRFEGPRSSMISSSSLMTTYPPTILRNPQLECVLTVEPDRKKLSGTSGSDHGIRALEFHRKRVRPPF